MNVLQTLKKGIVEGFWQTFCVKWVWQIFCVAWVWQTFCVKWVWQTFCIDLAYKKFDRWKAWIYLAPALVLLIIFTVYPIINTIRLAFLNGYDSSIELGWLLKGRYRGDPYPFKVGIQNFITVITNKEFFTILKNTLLLCVLTVPLSTFIALVIAVSLNSIKVLNRTLQTIYFLPYVTNSIAIGIVFAAMFTMSTVKNDGETVIVTAGIINNIIGLFGIAPVDWLGPQSTYNYWSEDS